MTLVLVRHGVAAHNLPGAKDPHPDDPGRFFDSPLTEYGRAQAAALSANVSMPCCELLVVAPLSRAIETGLLAFPAAKRGVGQKAQCIASDLVREFAPPLRYANRRRAREALEALFGDFVDFSELPSGPDPLFCQGDVRNGGGERWPDDVIARAFKFLGWLAHRPEKSIAVASHGVFLEVLLRILGALPHGKRVMNAEVRILVLESSSDESTGGWRVVEHKATTRPPEEVLRQECERRGVASIIA